MKTLADFKREMRVGRKVKTTHHQNMVGRDENGQPIWGDRDMGIREVAENRATQFSLWTNKNGEMRKSYCDWPKATSLRIDGNKATILEPDLRGCAGDLNKAALTAPKIPILTYEFID